LTQSDDSIVPDISTHSPDALALCWNVDLVTRSGFAFHVRTAALSDEPALGAFFEDVDKDDLRFRFLSAVQKVGHSQLMALVSVDHNATENFLAIEPLTGRILATAMMAADKTMETAEVAIAIRADFKGRGISWMLLEHVARFAASKGIRTLESVENRSNHQAIELERDMGWHASSCPGDLTLLILKTSLRPLQTPAVAEQSL
jgi:N-acetylglutamate synthase-like GNAT family acetyltransferase